MKLLAIKVGNDTIQPPGGAPTAPPGFLGSNLILLGIELLLFLAVILCLVYLVWGGISWINSGGDKHSLEAARAKIKYAIIGIVLAFFSFLVISFIGKIFDVQLLFDPNTIAPTTP